MNMKIKAQKVIYAESVGSLNEQISRGITDGWTPLGSHLVVVSHEQLRYSGMQHKDTIVSKEYSLTMVKYDTPTQNTIEVDIAYYHPNDDETIKVYDVEGMTQEFEFKLNQLINN